ncbi:MAG: hypothetical protein KDA21_05765, partial [Phycisphaerales bacterium]|nr:hypothetical protein [Phycisphaerales bacterium]
RPHPLARESRRRLEIELAASFIATWSVVPGVALVDRLLHWYGKAGRSADGEDRRRLARLLVESANARRRLAIMNCCAHEDPLARGVADACRALEVIDHRNLPLRIKAEAVLGELRVASGVSRAREAVEELEQLRRQHAGCSGSGWLDLCLANIIRRHLPEKMRWLPTVVGAGMAAPGAASDWDLQLELVCAEWGLLRPALEDRYWPPDPLAGPAPGAPDLEAVAVRIRRTTLVCPRFHETGLRLLRQAKGEDAEPTITDRIEHLYAIVCDARGWNRTQLAQATGRHLANLVPAGSPKSDLLIALAEALEWPVDDVAAAMLSPSRDRVAPAEEDDPGECGARAIAAWRSGDPESIRTWALRGLPRATPGRQRANQLSLCSKGWEMSGRFRDAEIYARRAAHEPNLSAAAHFLLADRLAFDEFLIGDVESAVAILQKAFEDSERSLSNADCRPQTRAHAHWLAGLLFLRLACLEPEDRSLLLRRAQEHVDAGERYVALTEERDLWAREAHRVLRATRLEIEVELHQRDAEATIREMVAALEMVEDPGVPSFEAPEPIARLQTFEYWCYAGLRLSRRWLKGPARERATGIFSNKGMELSERLGDWSLRLQMFSADVGLRCLHPMDWSAGGDALADGEVLLDEQDTRQLLLLMAALPGFFEQGHRILGSRRESS